jgi:ubiquinone/menaquinone biosynthesis C-methylase UbiE
MVSFERWYRALGESNTAYQRVAEAAYGQGQYVGQQGFSSRDAIVRLAEATIGQHTRRVLDLCCGAGAPLVAIRPRFARMLVGADLSASALLQARARLPEDLLIVQSEAEILPFAQASFDAALLIDSFASIVTPGALFCELSRVVQCAGRIGLTAEVGTPLSPAEQARFTRSRPPTVLTEAQLCALLHEAGFEIVEQRCTTSSVAGVARRLADGLRQAFDGVVADMGEETVHDLTATLGTLADMLGRGRLDEVVIVAQRTSRA